MRAGIDEALRHLTTQASTADSNIKRMLELHQAKMAEEAAGGVSRGPGPEDGARFLEELRDRATHELKVFRQALAVETRTALDEVGQLRDQKRTLQQELSELFSFKVRSVLRRRSADSLGQTPSRRARHGLARSFAHEKRRRRVPRRRCVFSSHWAR